jgi:predicted Fe-Mo cluster-binding NifX family protein
MKIAFTTLGTTPEAPLDSRFGRAPGFLVYDMDRDSFELVDNRQNLNAAQGAGIQAAETLSCIGVRALVTGHCGPNAFRVLATAGITVYSSDAQTVAGALNAFRSGSLQPLKRANIEGHHA